MGTGKQYSLHEISETRMAGRDEAFEEIIERVKSSGGKILKDEISPLYTEVGMEEFEIGNQRIVEFSLNKMDFQLTRNVETHILQGAGKQKHIEPLDPPRIKIVMKRKSQNSNDWQVVDFDEITL